MSPAATPRIIAQQADYFLIEKPAGLGFHQENGEIGLVDAVRALLPEDQRSALFPVHRLDRLTSGLVLFARSAAAAKEFGERFANGGIDKLYLALSARSPSKKQGWIKGAMLKGRNGSWRLAASGGPWAVTQFFSYGLANTESKGLRLFVVRPRSGRTHQIRVALKSLGSPILGDSRYAGPPADRGYLHAWALRFEWQGEMHSYQLAPSSGSAFVDPQLTERLRALGDPWALPWPGERKADA
jgi:tRNA pseudouridine32 synthase/23S rRNA pseudouridine746 synthase